MPQGETPQEARRRIFGESEQTERRPGPDVKPGRPAPSPPEPRDRLKPPRSLDRLRRLRDRLGAPAPTPQGTSAASVVPRLEQPASPALPPDEQWAAPASAPQQEPAAPAAPSRDEQAAPAPPPPQQAAAGSPAPAEVASSAPTEVEPAAAPAQPVPAEPAPSAPEEEPVTSSVAEQEEPAAPALAADGEPAADLAVEQQETGYSLPRSVTARPVGGDEFARQLSEQSSTLARHEKRLARLEQRETGTTAGIRVSPAFVASIVAFLAAEALVAAVVLALDSDLKTWAAAGIVGVGLMVIAIVVALIAKRHVD